MNIPKPSWWNLFKKDYITLREIYDKFPFSNEMNADEKQSAKACISAKAFISCLKFFLNTSL